MQQWILAILAFMLISTTPQEFLQDKTLIAQTACGERGAMVFQCDHYVDSEGTNYLAVFFAWGDLGAIKRQEGNGWVNIWLNPQYYSPEERQEAEQQRRHLTSI